MRSEGAPGVVSRKRGRPSNRRHSDALREQIIAIVREHYSDFGPTLAREYLIERHGITVVNGPRTFPRCGRPKFPMLASGLSGDQPYS